MKFILLIPVLMLFIGQTPWMKNMQELMTVTAEKNICSGKRKAAAKSCHKEEKEEKKDDCCQKPEARSGCVCCFSVAPVTEASTFTKFQPAIKTNMSLQKDDKLLSQFYPVVTPPPDHVIV